MMSLDLRMVNQEIKDVLFVLWNLQCFHGLAPRMWQQGNVGKIQLFKLFVKIQRLFR